MLIPHQKISLISHPDETSYPAIPMKKMADPVIPPKKGQYGHPANPVRPFHSISCLRRKANLGNMKPWRTIIDQLCSITWIIKMYHLGRPKSIRATREGGIVHMINRICPAWRPKLDNFCLELLQLEQIDRRLKGLNSSVKKKRTTRERIIWYAFICKEWISHPFLGPNYTITERQRRILTHFVLRNFSEKDFVKLLDYLKKNKTK